jgi:hypothetical protein
MHLMHSIDYITFLSSESVHLSSKRFEGSLYSVSQNFQGDFFLPYLVAQTLDRSDVQAACISGTFSRFSRVQRALNFCTRRVFQTFERGTTENLCAKRPVA